MIVIVWAHARFKLAIARDTRGQLHAPMKARRPGSVPYASPLSANMLTAKFGAFAGEGPGPSYRVLSSVFTHGRRSICMHVKLASA